MNDISYRQDFLARIIKISKKNLMKNAKKKKKTRHFKHLEDITLSLPHIRWQ